MIKELITGVTFFEEKNYQGKSHDYPELDKIISLPSNLNDKFRSVKIGKLSKVHAWRHYNDPESKYYEWVVDNPDIDREIRGLSKFRIMQKDTKLVALRVIDDTHSDTKFSMTVKIFNGEEQETIDVNATTDDNYIVVNELLVQKEIVTSIYVRNVNTGEYIGNGSFYFSYDAIGIATIDEGLNFPKNLKLVHVGNNRFDFHITSTDPIA
ncbi:hypothetical protein TI10_11215 [Photorhabdus luminescens subsp. luminescens]|uniref:Membrane binding n=1 Tax=Photorhabdus luminescens TaxID=29488 RepID=A0A1G5QYP8_PHOLU|nr:beta/gamma crystallin domain-containing protein [Photorhabdus luminescens]KMW72737.1 hypothetical protein TI10_11215 [Photorhabdus luminescens subsp. luminescens]SCZ66965.1 Membrane binding [Photorhabdus luminescens]